MKAFKILPFALASLALGACSSDDITENGGGSSDTPQFLAVNLSSVSETPGSRTEYTEGGGTYEDGTEAESKINKARFFFFNSDGTPYTLTDGKSYVDKDNFTDSGDKHTETVETLTEAVLVINGEKQTAPASIIAVINYDACPSLFTVSQANPTLSQLKETMKSTDFVNSEKTSFVMSNSVYAQAGQIMCETSVAGHIASDADAAKANPVEIYVERVVAKAAASIDADAEGSAWTKTENGSYRTKVGEYQGNPVYAVVLGWGIADKNSEATVEKQIGKSGVIAYTDASLGIKPWNTADYHRCFWETAPLGTDAPINKTFNEYNLTFNDACDYMLPNTPTTATWANNDAVLYKQETDLTKILVATKLEIEKTDENGTKSTEPAEICEYMGIQYLGEENVKKAIANYFPKYYVSSDATNFTSIDPAQIVFKTAEEIEGVNKDDTRDYHVIPQYQLKEGEKLYIIKNAQVTNPTADDLEEVELSKFNGTDGLAKNIHYCQIRKDGQAYYFTPIQHLAAVGNDLGRYGVVRNHSYKITINSIKGFGTPVYDPDKKIIQPEVPTNDNTYLAATIKALSWRVVSQTIDLDKTSKN